MAVGAGDAPSVVMIDRERERDIILPYPTPRWSWGRDARKDALFAQRGLFEFGWDSIPMHLRNKLTHLIGEKERREDEKIIGRDAKNGTITYKDKNGKIRIVNLKKNLEWALWGTKPDGSSYLVGYQLTGERARLFWGPGSKLGVEYEFGIEGGNVGALVNSWRNETSYISSVNFTGNRLIIFAIDSNNGNGTIHGLKFQIPTGFGSMSWDENGKAKPRKKGEDALNIKHCDFSLSKDFNVSPFGYTLNDIMDAGNIITISDDGKNTYTVHTGDGGYFKGTLNNDWYDWFQSDWCSNWYLELDDDLPDWLKKLLGIN